MYIWRGDSDASSKATWLWFSPAPSGRAAARSTAPAAPTRATQMPPQPPLRSAAALHAGVLLGGLTNQIYGLVGLVFMANLTGSPLVLPHMLSHVDRGSASNATFRERNLS